AILFNWSEQQGAVLLDRNDLDITGSLVIPGKVYLEGSAPPEFMGVNQVISANAIGIQNPGNTLVIDWRTAAGSFDRTKFYDGNLTFRIFRRTNETDWQELSGAQPSPNQNGDPIERYPYFGNTDARFIYEDTNLEDGKEYYYKVTAIDDTSPYPNEMTNTAVISGIPKDLTAPQEVSKISAVPDNNLISLSWKNPSDDDLAGVVIMKNENKPVGTGLLGSATASGDGPEYQIGDTPFGQGNGMVIYVSPQATDQFDDYYAINGQDSYYKIFTYDLASPTKFGRNHSKGAVINAVAGTAPEPITNLKAEIGEYQGEILITWNNSPDEFAGGTLIRFTTDEKLKFAILKNEKSGALLDEFPVYGDTGELDGYFISGFKPETTYYLKAFTHNATPQPLDPKDPKSVSSHHFTPGPIVSVYLPNIDAGETVVKALSVEPSPKVRVWFGKRVYRQALVDKGLDFSSPSKPTIKMEVSIPEPYSLDQSPSSYYMVMDNAVTYTFKKKTIEKNQATFELDLPDKLTPGEHTFSFIAKSSGSQAKAASIAEQATVTVHDGPLAITDRPLSFPSPFNPERDKRVIFQYTLSNTSNIDLMIIDITGKIVKKIPINSGEEGAMAQLNKVTWDGITTEGRPVANGLYIVNILSRDNKKSLGKLKLTVYR
ncbi:MAG: hypothetical protein ABIA67_01030, partial [Candidatus Margulisiibacteriota bacterium]